MFRHAIRRLRATPAFTALAVVSLALGLGVTTAIYSTLASVLWSPSPVREPSRVVVVTAPAVRGTRSFLREADFDAIRAQVRSVPELATSRLLLATVNDGARTLEIMAEAVSGNYFGITGLTITRGRGLDASDERSDQQQALVLSRAIWESKLGRDPGIVGATVRVSGHVFVVVGIAGGREASARDLYGQFRLGSADAWITHTGAALVDGAGRDRTAPDLGVIARLPDGQDVSQVAAEFAALAGSLDATDPLPTRPGAPPRPRGWSAATIDSIEHSAGIGSTQFGAAILAFVGLVLIVACTNIANLVVGRGSGRQREFAVRRALGATRGRLIVEQLAESGVLAVLGSAGGLLFAAWLCRILTSDLPVVGTSTLSIRPELDVRAFLTMGAAMLMSLVVFGIAPAIHLTRTAARNPLAGGSGGETLRWRGRRWLIALQVSISTALLILASAALTGVVNEARHDAGFDLSRLSIGIVNFRSLKWDHARIDRAVSALDAMTDNGFGSSSAALTIGLPIGAGGLRRLGTVTAGDRRAATVVLTATSRILETLDVRVLRGRGFDPNEVASKAPVIVVSERVARDLFDTADAVGRRLTYFNAAGDSHNALEVIGVTRDTDTDQLFDRRVGAVYVPLWMRKSDDSLAILARSSDPAAMTTTVAQVIRRADPDLGPAFVGTGERLLTPAYLLLRAAASLAGGLSILAAAMAMLGLFGVLSHLVAKRTREIGVRLALGADAGGVRRMVIADGMRPVIWGIAFGLLAGAGGRVAIQRTLIRSLAATDMTSFTLVAALLLVTGLVASAVPALRASRVDPSIALRDL